MTNPLVTAYRSGGHSERIMAAFAKGCGCQLTTPDRGLAPGTPAIWGLLRGAGDVLRQAMREGRRFYYVDHAYLVRGHYHSNYRIAIDDLQATGPILERPDDRWQRWRRDVRIEPWRTGGRHILLCPPSPTVANFFGKQAWLPQVMTALRRYTDRQIRVRTKEDAAGRPLALDLVGCHAVVTYQSMVAVEAVLAGVPVVVSPRSAAAPVGRIHLEQIEDPARPDREPWLHHLAYCQFHLTEIGDGTAWRILQDTIGRASSRPSMSA